MRPTGPRLAAALLAAALTLPGAATAQSGALDRERDAVFTRMLAAPADRALMLAYARLSVQLRDFEAAAATLERILDQEPGNAAARLELATAYFALGAHQVADYHLAAAAASGGLTPDQRAQADRYLAESAARQDPQQITGRIALGRAWTRERDQSGLFGTAQLDWRIDMGGPQAQDWLTQLAFSRFAPGEADFTERQSTRLRSGPEFRLTGDAYGPRLQPYLELTWLREEGGFEDADTVALGLAYQNPHNAFWTSHADVQVGRGDRRDAFAPDVAFRGASVGLTFRPSRATRLRGTVGWREEEEVDTLFPVLETTRSLRLEALHSFDTGWTALPHRWEARGWIQRESVERGDTFGTFTDHTDTGYGLGLRAFVTEALFVEARGARLEREDGFGFAPPPETVYALQVGWEF